MLVDDFSQEKATAVWAGRYSPQSVTIETVTDSTDPRFASH